MALSVVYVIAMAAVVTFGFTGVAPVDQVAGPVMVVFGLVAVGFGVRVSRSRKLDAATRRSWTLVTAALCLALATPVLFFFVTGARPFPQPGDGAHMGFVIVLFVALQSFPLSEASRRERWKAVLDSATVALGALMVLWYLVIGPALTSEKVSLRLILAAAAYPVVDLLALFAFARVLLRGTSRATRRPLWLLSIGVLAVFIGDAYLGYTQAQTEMVQRTPWQFACWLTMHFMLACGAVDQSRWSTGPTAETGRPTERLAGKLPYAGIAVGYTLMVVAAAHEAHPFPWAGLVVGGMGITGLVVLRQVLTQNETADAAATDGLTGLANRATLHRALTRALGRGDNHRVGVLLIDLNGFKHINDTLGHQAGDILLVAAAAAMQRCIRRDDIVGRLGGDEFALVLPDITGVQDALAVAQRIAGAIAEPVIADGVPLRVSASIGVAVNDDGAPTADEILHRADVAMYIAKRRGDAYETWRPALETETGEHDTVETELAAAGACGQLRMMYQPIVTLTTGRIAGAQASLWWDHPVRGPLDEDAVFSIAERSGDAVAIAAWVLQQAIDEVTRWHQVSDQELYVSVRLMPQRMGQGALAGEIRTVLQRNSGDLRYLTVELTGDATMHDSLATAQELREWGVGVAVDDLGTGAQSHLTRFEHAMTGEAVAAMVRQLGNVTRCGADR